MIRTGNNDHAHLEVGQREDSFECFRVFGDIFAGIRIGTRERDTKRYPFAPRNIYSK